MREDPYQRIEEMEAENERRSDYLDAEIGKRIKAQNARDETLARWALAEKLVDDFIEKAKRKGYAGIARRGSNFELIREGAVAGNYDQGGFWGGSIVRELVIQAGFSQLLNRGFCE